MARSLGVERLLAREAELALRPTPAGPLSFLFVNGWRMDSSTVTALAFERGARLPSFVAKIGAGAGAAAVAAERNNLELLHRSSDEGFRTSVPRVLHHAEEQGIAVLFETAVGGRPLRVPRREGALSRVATLVTGWLLRFHRGTCPAAEPHGGPRYRKLVTGPFARYLARFRPAREERAFLERNLKALAGFEGRGLPLVFQHGDLCPANLFVEGDRLRVIDWEAPFEPGLPAHDLIHFLACLGNTRGNDPDDFRCFEEAFFGDGPLPRVAREAILGYARTMEIPAEALRPLFTLYWISYALEKVDALGRPGGRSDTWGGPDAWRLARFADGTCLNLRKLAQSEKGFFLP